MVLMRDSDALMRDSVELPRTSSGEVPTKASPTVPTRRGVPVSCLGSELPAVVDTSRCQAFSRNAMY